MKEEKQKKQSNAINKLTYHNYLWYMIIFSILGLIIEAIFSAIVSGKLERVNGPILGPLCVIYGLAAVIIIALLNKYKEHKIKLFVYGALLGATTEYIISFILEAIFGVKFWQRSWSAFNINGRICLEYSIIWGILALLTIAVLKKYIDKIINKIQGKTRKILDIILTIILVLYIAITIWGITVYTIRAKETLNGKNYISNNNAIEKFQNMAFSNEIMSKLFPNMSILANTQNEILVKDIFNK